MKIAIASFIRNGCVWNQKLAEWKKHSCEGYAIEKHERSGISAIAPSLLAGWTELPPLENGVIVYRVSDCGAQYCTVREK